MEIMRATDRKSIDARKAVDNVLTRRVWMGTVWLTQEQMAGLFQKVRSTIAEHINNIFEEGSRNSNVHKLHIANHRGGWYY